MASACMPRFLKDRLRERRESGGLRNDSLRFVQVLEGPDHSTIIRFTVLVARGEEPTLSLVSSTGDAMDATIRILERIDCEGREQLVMSASFAGRPRAFTLMQDGRPVARMTEARIARLVAERDLDMVNPGIDAAYVSAHHTGSTESLESEATTSATGPLMSIVMPVFETPPRFLAEAIASVRAQTYPNWELIIANASPEDEGVAQVLAVSDDERIRVLDLGENAGIVQNTNAGIRAARGSYIAFLDHDDALDPQALAAYANRIEQDEDIDLLYSDEDSFRDDPRNGFRPLFKPGPLRSFLYAHNYIGHFLMLSRRVLEQGGLPSPEANGAQDYDMVLKAFEHARSIEHVPQVLYHWREHEGSTNGGAYEGKPYVIRAAIGALKRHFGRRGITVSSASSPRVQTIYEHSFVRRKEHATWSLVLLCDKAQPSDDALCALRSLGATQTIIVAPRDAELADEGYDGVETIRAEGADWAALLNAGVAAAGCDSVCAVSTAVCLHAIPEGAFEELLGILMRPEVGIAGPRLLYRDGLIHAAGLVICEDGSIARANHDFATDNGGGYLGMAACTGSYSAVPPDCLVLRKSTFESIGGARSIASERIASCVDLCLRMGDAGYEVVMTPQVDLVVDEPVWWHDRIHEEMDEERSALEGLWEQRGGIPRDVLYNPHVEYSSWYPRLKAASKP